MKLLLIADGRSPITRRWIKMLQPLGYTITLASTYPCSPIVGVREVIEMPLAFAGMAGSQAGGAAKKTPRRTHLIARLRAVASDLRHWLGPWTVERKEKEYLDLLARVKPYGHPGDPLHLG